jgi:D-alanine-D-alanine ligase
MIGTVVGVLRGGPSKEHDVSLKTGHAVLKHLPKDRYTARDIFIDKEGQWHLSGKPVAPVEALRSLDAVIIGLHGEYGEDGEVQKLLERFGVPYTGSASFPSYLAMHKLMAKKRAEELGILTPRYRYVDAGTLMDAVLADVVRTFTQPVVVKPVRWGSSVGISLVSGYAPLHQAVRSLIASGAGGVLIEERVQGREATAGVVEHLRGEALYGLPVVEIVPPEGDFFSYDAKYSGASREVCPGNFDKETAVELSRLAKAMHEALGLRHYSRSDFIVSAKGIYYLETNTLPGMTTESLLPKSLAAVGVSFPDFLSHLVGLSLGHGTRS